MGEVFDLANVDPAILSSSLAYSREKAKQTESLNKDLLEFKKSYATLSAIIGDEDLDFRIRLNAITKLILEISAFQAKEAVTSYPNRDRTSALSRVVVGLTQVANNIRESSKHEANLEFDPYSPKVQIVFGWFIEVLAECLLEASNEAVKNSVFDVFSRKLIGWEEEVSKRLKGVSVKALAHVPNPLLNRTEEIVN